MEPATIEFDGHIDLIDRQETDQTTDADRARQSRLADVMIVLERERVSLEQALHVRLAGAVAHGIDSLALELDATAPKFHVAIQPTPVDHAWCMTPDQRSAFEGEIADEVRALIEQRAARSPTTRWQPVVTATWRSAASAEAPGSTLQETVVTDGATPPSAPAPTSMTPNRAAPDAAPRSRMQSIWLYLLFWLLALMVVGTAALYWLSTQG